MTFFTYLNRPPLHLRESVQEASRVSKEASRIFTEASRIFTEASRIIQRTSYITRMLLSQILSIFAVISLAVGTPLDAGKSAENFEAIQAVEARDLVKRECGIGKVWGGNRESAIERSIRWCSGSGGSGRYGTGQKKTGCYNAPNGNNKFEFEILRTGTSPGTLSSGQCEQFMREQIRNCRDGGQGERGNWFFRYDKLVFFFFFGFI
jgi:hypothetical protein